jgi:D-alanine-D-alanine ligase
MTIAVIFGGPAPEHDVSILTGLQAVRELQRNEVDVTPIYWDKEGNWFGTPQNAEGKDFLEGAPKDSELLSFVLGANGGFFQSSGRFGRDKKIDIAAALICCHGSPGEDGTLQSALDLASIPYTGPSAAGAALGMDKLAFGAVAMNVGLPTLPRDVLRKDRNPNFGGPYIMKPRYGGSSIGIEVVEDYDTALALQNNSVHFAKGAIIEPYRDELIDLNIAVRTYPEVELSTIERPLRSGPGILNYADKYVGGEGFLSAPRELPAQIPEDVERAIRAATKRLVAAASVRGLARVDYLWHEDAIYVNEINTIPGSLAKYLWTNPPLAFSTLLSDLLDEAVKYPTHAYSSEGADGAALRAAGQIAAKLD